MARAKCEAPPDLQTNVVPAEPSLHVDSPPSVAGSREPPATAGFSRHGLATGLRRNREVESQIGLAKFVGEKQKVPAKATHGWANSEWNPAGSGASIDDEPTERPSGRSASQLLKRRRRRRNLETDDHGGLVEGEAEDEEGDEVLEQMWIPPSSSSTNQPLANGPDQVSARDVLGDSSAEGDLRQAGMLKTRLALIGDKLDSSDDSNLMKTMMLFQRGRLISNRMSEICDKFEKWTASRKYKRVVESMEESQQVVKPMTDILEFIISHRYDEINGTLASILKASMGHKLDKQELDELEQHADARFEWMSGAAQEYAAIHSKRSELQGHTTDTMRDVVLKTTQEIQALTQKISEDTEERVSIHRSHDDYEHEMYEVARRHKQIRHQIQDIEDARASRVKAQAARVENLRQELLLLSRRQASMQKQIEDTRQRCQEVMSRIEMRVQRKMLSNLDGMLGIARSRRVRDHAFKVRAVQLRHDSLKGQVEALRGKLAQKCKDLSDAMSVREVLDLRLQVLEAKCIKLELDLRAHEVPVKGAQLKQEFPLAALAALAPPGADTIDQLPVPAVEVPPGIFQLLLQELDRQQQWLAARGQAWEFDRYTLKLTKKPSIKTPLSLMKSVHGVIREMEIQENTIKRIQLVKQSRQQKHLSLAKKAAGRFKGLLAPRQPSALAGQDSSSEVDQVSGAQVELDAPLDKRCKAALDGVLLREDFLGDDVGHLSSRRLSHMASQLDGQENERTAADLLQPLAGLSTTRQALQRLNERWAHWSHEQGKLGNPIFEELVPKFTAALADLAAGLDVVQACAYWFDAGCLPAGVFTDLLHSEIRWLPMLATLITERCGELRAMLEVMESCAHRRVALNRSAKIVNEVLQNLHFVLNEEVKEMAESWMLRLQQGLRKKAQLHLATADALRWFNGKHQDNEAILGVARRALEALTEILTAPQLESSGSWRKATEPELTGMVRLALGRVLKDTDPDAHEAAVLALAVLHQPREKESLRKPSSPRPESSTGVAAQGALDAEQAAAAGAASEPGTPAKAVTPEGEGIGRDSAQEVPADTATAAGEDEDHWLEEFDELGEDWEQWLDDDEKAELLYGDQVEDSPEGEDGVLEQWQQQKEQQQQQQQQQEQQREQTASGSPEDVAGASRPASATATDRAAAGSSCSAPVAAPQQRIPSKRTQPKRLPVAKRVAVAKRLAAKKAAAAAAAADPASGEALRAGEDRQTPSGQRSISPRKGTSPSPSATPRSSPLPKRFPSSPGASPKARSKGQFATTSSAGASPKARSKGEFAAKAEAGLELEGGPQEGNDGEDATEGGFSLDVSAVDVAEGNRQQDADAGAASEAQGEQASESEGGTTNGPGEPIPAAKSPQDPTARLKMPIVPKRRRPRLAAAATDPASITAEQGSPSGSGNEDPASDGVGGDGNATPKMDGKGWLQHGRKGAHRGAIKRAKTVNMFREASGAAVQNEEGYLADPPLQGEGESGVPDVIVWEEAVPSSEAAIEEDWGEVDEAGLVKSASSSTRALVVVSPTHEEDQLETSKRESHRLEETPKSKPLRERAGKGKPVLPVRRKQKEKVDELAIESPRAKEIGERRSSPSRQDSGSPARLKGSSSPRKSLVTGLVRPAHFVRETFDVEQSPDFEVDGHRTEPQPMLQSREGKSKWLSKGGLKKDVPNKDVPLLEIASSQKPCSARSREDSLQHATAQAAPDGPAKTLKRSVMSREASGTPAELQGGVSSRAHAGTAPMVSPRDPASAASSAVASPAEGAGGGRGRRPGVENTRFGRSGRTCTPDSEVESHPECSSSRAAMDVPPQYPWRKVDTDEALGTDWKKSLTGQARKEGLPKDRMILPGRQWDTEAVAARARAAERPQAKLVDHRHSLEPVTDLPSGRSTALVQPVRKSPDSLPDQPEYPGMAASPRALAPRAFRQDLIVTPTSKDKLIQEKPLREKPLREKPLLETPSSAWRAGEERRQLEILSHLLVPPCASQLLVAAEVQAAADDAPSELEEDLQSRSRNKERRLAVVDMVPFEDMKFVQHDPSKALSLTPRAHDSDLGQRHLVPLQPTSTLGLVDDGENTCEDAEVAVLSRSAAWEAENKVLNQVASPTWLAALRVGTSHMIMEREQLLAGDGAILNREEKEETKTAAQSMTPLGIASRGFGLESRGVGGVAGLASAAYEVANRRRESSMGINVDRGRLAVHALAAASAKAASAAVGVEAPASKDHSAAWQLPAPHFWGSYGLSSAETALVLPVPGPASPTTSGFVRGRPELVAKCLGPQAFDSPHSSSHATSGSVLGLKAWASSSPSAKFGGGGGSSPSTAAGSPRKTSLPAVGGSVTTDARRRWDRAQARLPAGA